MASEEKFREYVDIIARLRAPDGCPWDREQTHESLRGALIEETYEVLDAMERGDNKDFCSELGDVLLQVVFHAQLAAEEGVFDIDDVIKSSADKMVSRHPHVFGDAKSNTSEEVLAQWERIKQSEGAAPKPVMSMNENLPALMLAGKLFDKCGRVDIKAPEQEPIAAEELGAALFELVLRGRASGIDAEEAMRAYTRSMLARFRDKELSLRTEGRAFADLTEEETAALWQREV